MSTQTARASVGGTQRQTMILGLGVIGILCGTAGMIALLDLLTLPIGTPRDLSLEKGRRLGLSLGAASLTLSAYALSQRWWLGSLGLAIGSSAVLLAVLLAP
jgi:hypothetical protein